MDWSTIRWNKLWFSVGGRRALHIGKADMNVSGKSIWLALFLDARWIREMAFSVVLWAQRKCGAACQVATRVIAMMGDVLQSYLLVLVGE
jgi:hypothetical protein